MRIVKFARKRRLRIWGIVAECSLVLFILSACLSGPIGTSRSNPVPLGQSYRYDDLEVKVLDFERSEGYLSAQAEAGGSFAIVSLQIRNVGAPEKSQRYNTINFAVVGDRGKVYDDWQTDIVYEYEGKALRSGELYGGDSVTGTIIRTVDTDDSHLVLRWSTGFRGAKEHFLALE